MDKIAYRILLSIYITYHHNNFFKLYHVVFCISVPLKEEIAIHTKQRNFDIVSCIFLQVSCLFEDVTGLILKIVWNCVESIIVDK
jgi:spore maturation protein CgeB